MSSSATSDRPVERRAGVTIALSLAGFLALGVLVESASSLSRAREALRRPEVPTSVLEVGPLGKILKERGLLVAATDAEAPPDEVGAVQLRANPGGPGNFPSTRVVGPEDFVEGLPLLSLVIDDEDLHDGARGIVANWSENWERLGWATYYDAQGALRFATGVGIRLHGGATRDPANQARRGHEWHSYRLYFRDAYGANQVPPGALFGPTSEPLKKLIVRGNFFLDNGLGFDVARRVGAVAPPLELSLFYLNGELQGYFSLIEHLNQRQWRAHVGHDDFLFYRHRADNDAESQAAFEELWSWGHGLGSEARVDRVAERIDMDAYARHLFSIAFCGTEDWSQGAAILDRREPEPRWRWINWDMDASFHRPLPPGSPPMPAWEKRALNLFLSQQSRTVRDVRGALFRSLVAHDPAFGKFFVDLSTELLNHRVTSEWCTERVHHWQQLAAEANIDRGVFEGRLRFLRNRGDFFRSDLQRLFGLEEPCTLEVTGPPESALRIDGYDVPVPWRGVYFPGQVVRLERVDGTALGSVDGRRIEQGSFELTLARDAHVELLPSAASGGVRR